MSTQTTGAGPARPDLSLIACIAICMLGPLSGLVQTALPPVMPRIAEHFSYVPNADVLVRLMATGLSAALIVGALASGFLAEKFGQMRLLYSCLSIYALSGVASYFADNLYVLVLLRIVLGAVNSAAGVLATALIVTRMAEGKRESWLGYYVVIGSFGSLLWITLAGLLGAIDWRLIFLLQLVALPAALFLYLTFPKEAREARTPAETSATAGAGIPWAMVFFGLMCGAIGSSTFIYLPFHLDNIGLGDPAKIGPLMMVGMGAGAIFALAFGTIRKFVSAIPVFIAGFTVTGLGLVLTLAAESYAMLFVTVAIYSAGFAVITPNLFAACAAATPVALRTRVLGFMRAGFYAGPLVVQPILELVLKSSSAGGALLAIAIGSFIAALVFAAGRRKFAPVVAAPA
jgi:predicted MFS family arabinose efflux permease